MSLMISHVVFNASSQTLQQLACVKVSSFTDGISYVLPATPDDDVIGIVVSPIAPGTRGTIAVLGIASGITTSYNTGTLLYVGSDGYLTNINNGKQHVAVILNSGPNGTIYLNTTVIESFATSGNGVSGPNNPEQNGIAFFTGAGVLGTTPFVQVDPSIQGLMLGGAKVSGLLGPMVLLNNQSSFIDLISYPMLNNEDMILQYSLVQDGQRSVGEMIITAATSGASLMHRFGETSLLGVEFQVVTVGPNVVLRYRTQNTGFNTSFRYKFTRWGGQ